MSDAVVASPPAAADLSDREQFWRKTLAAFSTSGLSVRAFCRQHGLHEKRFYTWRRNLGLSPLARPATSTTPATGFVPVRVVSDSSLEVVLPSGLTVRVPASADVSHVARLVHALRATPC